MSISSDILAAVIGALIAVFATIFLEYLRNRGKKKSNSLSLAYTLEKFAVMCAEQIGTTNIKIEEYIRTQDASALRSIRWPVIAVPENIDLSSLDHKISGQAIDLLLQTRIVSADLPYTTGHLDPALAAEEWSRVFGELGYTALKYATKLRKDARLPNSVLIHELSIEKTLRSKQTQASVASH